MEYDSQATDTLEGLEDIKNNTDDPRIIQIIEDVIQQVRFILNQFDEFIHEVWDLFQMLGELFSEIRNLFGKNQVPQETEEMMPAEV